MRRFLTIALLAGAAIPAAALAQDDRPRSGDDRRQAIAERRAERPANAERTPRVERQRSFVAPAAPAAVARPQAQAPAQVQAQRDWRGSRGGDATGRGSQRQSVQARPDAAMAAPAWNQRGPELRGQGRVAQSQDRGVRGGDFNRGRNDQRRDLSRNDRRWDSNNRDARNWNGSWRNDRRYDWQGYRNSNRSAYRLPRYYAPSGWQYGYRRFNTGSYLFAGLFARDYWISDPYNYRLPPVSWPYQWVRYYDDALLVDTETGQVVDSIPGIFW